MVDSKLCHQCNKGHLNRFLFFRGEWFKDDYIKECKTWTCMECRTRHG